MKIEQVSYENLCMAEVNVEKMSIAGVTPLQRGGSFKASPHGNHDVALCPEDNSIRGRCSALDPVAGYWRLSSV